MKYFATLVIFGLFCGAASAQSYDAISSAFDQMTQMSSAGKSGYTDVEFKNAKLRIPAPSSDPISCPPVTPGQPRLCMGIKIWAELAEGPNAGKLVNITKHKWQRKERFWLHIASGFPVYVTLSQNYPDGLKESRLVVPDEDYPQSFSAVVPATDYRFPIMLEMDDDLRDETVEVMFVRADTSIVPMSRLADGNAQAEAGGSAEGVGATIKASHAKLSKLSQSVAQSHTYNGQSTKLNIANNSSGMTSSDTPGDVSVVMVGPGYVHAAEITFHKD